jgi:putative ABC transport system substrate-binding protein
MGEIKGQALRIRSILAGLALAAAWSSPSLAVQYKVMIVTWRGCEEVCKGFQDYFKERHIDAEFIVRDAAQRDDVLPAFLQEARASKVDLILTWGTSVTRGIAGKVADAGNPAFDRKIPKVFTVVADPVGLGVVSSLERPGRPDVTGTYNRVPEEVNIRTIRSYIPGFKRLGLLYNANERNSVLKRDELAGLASSLRFELIAIALPLTVDGKPRAEDIAPKMAELRDAKVDFVYLGSSSFLQENADAVTGAALRSGIPLLSSYESMVRDSQALISVAARYYDVGRLAGIQAEKILVRRMAAGDLPVLRMKDFAIVINMNVAKKLKRFPPLDLLQIAETVN